MQCYLSAHILVNCSTHSCSCSGGLLGARGVAGDSCLYGETYALRMVRARYPDSARAQQAAQYYLGGGPALTGPQILLRVFNINVTALQAYQSDPEVSHLLCCAPQLSHFSCVARHSNAFCNRQK